MRHHESYNNMSELNKRNITISLFSLNINMNEIDLSNNMYVYNVRT